MLRETDVLSIHVPLTSDTVSLVGEKWIRMLKPGSILINTARGKVVDEEAMIRALQDGHVGDIFSSVVLQPTDRSQKAWWGGFGCLSRWTGGGPSFIKIHQRNATAPYGDGNQRYPEGDGSACSD